VIQHPRVADTVAVISSGSFVTAHWFVVANTVVQFMAAVAAVASGVAATWYYVSKRRHKE
jgi:hypothetical protein